MVLKNPVSKSRFINNIGLFFATSACTGSNTKKSFDHFLFQKSLWSRHRSTQKDLILVVIVENYIQFSANQIGGALINAFSRFREAILIHFEKNCISHNIFSYFERMNFGRCATNFRNCRGLLLGKSFASSSCVRCLFQNEDYSGSCPHSFPDLCWMGFETSPERFRSGFKLAVSWESRKDVLTQLICGFLSCWTLETTFLWLFPHFSDKLELYGLLVIWELSSFEQNYSLHVPHNFLCLVLLIFSCF